MVTQIFQPTPQSGLYCQEVDPCKHQVLCTPASWLKTCSFPLSLPELKYLPWREKSLSNRSRHPPLGPITAATAGGSLAPGEGRDYLPHNSSHLPVCPPQTLTKDWLHSFIYEPGNVLIHFSTTKSGTAGFLNSHLQWIQIFLSFCSITVFGHRGALNICFCTLIQKSTAFLIPSNIKPSPVWCDGCSHVFLNNSLQHPVPCHTHQDLSKYNANFREPC